MNRRPYRRGAASVSLLVFFVVIGLALGILIGLPGFGVAVAVGAWLGVRGTRRGGGGGSGPKLRPQRGTEPHLSLASPPA